MMNDFLCTSNSYFFINPQQDITQLPSWHAILTEFRSLSLSKVNFLFFLFTSFPRITKRRTKFKRTHKSHLKLKHKTNKNMFKKTRKYKKKRMHKIFRFFGVIFQRIKIK